MAWMTQSLLRMADSVSGASACPHFRCVVIDIFFSAAADCVKQDLVSTVRRRLERLRVIRKENEVQFDMLT